LKGLFAGWALCLLILSTEVNFGSPSGQQAGVAARDQGGPAGQGAAVDPRVQQRTYLSKDSNEELPYCPEGFNVDERRTYLFWTWQGLAESDCSCDPGRLRLDIT